MRFRSLFISHTPANGFDGPLASQLAKRGCYSGAVILLPKLVSTLSDLFFCWLFHFRCFRIVGIGNGRSVQAQRLLSNPNV